ncbi:MAG: GTP 3',8-cyclase MoaA [Deltaproteobacteria bacterium]|nr:MAG: GTP 3',8-cyclase MoaA [Deltaproteobacteria bacterium]
MSLPVRQRKTMPESGPLVDPFNRVHTYLRVSVTDRCNYRCVYCLPAEGVAFMRRDRLLTYEEIARLVRIFASMGIERVRLTGGEPTVRKDLVALVEQLGQIGLKDLSMTTNGHLFAPHAEALAKAGLTRVNVSLDTLDAEKFERITRGGSLERVLAGIDAARAHGITPIKINCVVVRDENEDELERMVEAFGAHAKDTQVRFIEKMPFGAESQRFVPSQSLRERLAERFTLEPVDRLAGVGPATTFRIAETGLVVGFISPMSEHFCHHCNRLRLQADGELRTCLSRDDTPSLRDLMRRGDSDEALEQAIRRMVWGKVAGHEAHLDGDAFTAFEGVMTTIGG